MMCAHVCLKFFMAIRIIVIVTTIAKVADEGLYTFPNSKAGGISAIRYLHRVSQGQRR